MSDLIEFDLLDVVHVVDGDTFDALVRDNNVGEVDGWKLSATKVIRIRLIHLDTPERGKPGYMEAAEDLRIWLRDTLIDGDVRVLAQRKRDAFGRYLADVYFAADRADTASDYMVRERHWDVWHG